MNEGQGVPVCQRSFQSWATRDGWSPWELTSCFFKIIYFWLHLVFTVVCGICLVVACGGYSPISELGLLIAVGSLVAEHSL